MSKRFLKYYAILFPLVMVIGSVILYNTISVEPGKYKNDLSEVSWQAPEINWLPVNPVTDQIRYGKELIANTSRYLGPKGSVARISNGMNCQNCHIDAGTRINGNSFGAVASTYPKFRERSGRIESIEYRINECMERSLNGKSIDSTGKEMKAMVAYIKWVGKDVKKGIKPAGTGIDDIHFLDRAADPVNGKLIYRNKCQSCHGMNGEGLIKTDSSGYLYPPLWGSRSYNVSAGLYRLSRFAGFVKHNMPFVATPTEPQLTDVEAWDVAAFVNSQKRPEKFFPYDWKNIAKKPVDYPYGPFADNYSASQHKFGPFSEMKRSISK